MTQPRTMLELCADGRLAPPPATGGLYLHLSGTGNLDTDPHFAEVNGRPEMPQITPVSYGPGEFDLGLVLGFLDRTPPEALDLMAHVPLLSVDGKLDARALGARADELRLPVQVRTANLADGGPELPLAQHRLIPLDEQGRVTTLAGSVMVRVVPTDSRTAGVYDGVTADVADVWAGNWYLSGRIAFGPDGSVQLGRPAGLLNSWYGQLLAGFGRPLDDADVQAAGAERVVVAGYADLLRRLGPLPVDSQRLVELDRADGRTDVFLAHQGSDRVPEFLDLGAGTAAVFPADPRELRLTDLAGTMPLGDRLDALRLGVRAEPSWPLVLPKVAGHDGEVFVVGDDAPPAVLKTLAGKIGQPVVFLGRFGGDERANASRLTALGSLLEQLGWREAVPVVVTTVRLDAAKTEGLTALLDRYDVSLVHQVAGHAGGVAPTGGLVSFLGNPWTVRPAGRPPAGVEPPHRDTLTEDLLAYAAGKGRRPRFGPPPEPVATFLTTSLTEHAGRGIDPGAVRTLSPLVEQIATRDPFFAAHNAALQLTGLGHGDAVTAYLGDEAERGAKIFQPLLAVGGGTASERRHGVRELLPHLAALAGGEVDDLASHAILGALNDLLTGAVEADTIRHRIQRYKSYLPDTAKVPWVRRLGELQASLPEHRDQFEKLATAIMEC